MDIGERGCGEVWTGRRGKMGSCGGDIIYECVHMHIYINIYLPKSKKKIK